MWKMNPESCDINLLEVGQGFIESMFCKPFDCNWDLKLVLRVVKYCYLGLNLMHWRDLNAKVSRY